MAPHKRSTIRRVLELLESGEPDAAILVLRQYVEKMEKAWGASAGKKSEARSRAARENGKKGGRPPSDPEAAKRRWEARIRSAAEEGDAHGVARLQALEALAAEAQERGEYSVPAPEFVGTAKDFAGFRNLSKLPPGVMKGSDLEGRG